MDNEILNLRIENNLIEWESYITKYKGLRLNKKIMKLLEDNISLRFLLASGTPGENEEKAYKIAKHLIKAGRVYPSRVVITNIDDCYNCIRGFGELATLKKKLFSNRTQLIIIENMRNIRPADSKDNVQAFWSSFLPHLDKHKKINVLLAFDKYTPGKWLIGQVSKDNFLLL